MSNALTQTEHIQDPRDVVTAAVEMDEYHFYLRALHNNATRYAGYETEAGFYPKTEDSITGVKDAVQNSLRPLELEVTQTCLEYWGSQQYPPRILDPDKLKAEVKGWESIAAFRTALQSESHRVTERQHCLKYPAVDHRERTGTGYPGASKSYPFLNEATPDQYQPRVRQRRGGRWARRWRSCSWIREIRG